MDPGRVHGSSLSVHAMPTTQTITARRLNGYDVCLREVRVLPIKVITGLIVSALGILLVAVNASPASAAGTSASVPGAWGSVTKVRGDGPFRVELTFRVKDTMADGDHAQARVQVLTSDNHLYWYRWHYAFGKGRVTAMSGYAWNSEGIDALRVQACRVGDDLPDICDVSSWVHPGSDADNDANNRFPILR